MPATTPGPCPGPVPLLRGCGSQQAPRPDIALCRVSATARLSVAAAAHWLAAQDTPRCLPGPPQLLPEPGESRCAVRLDVRPHAPGGIVTGLSLGMVSAAGTSPFGPRQAETL